MSSTKFSRSKQTKRYTFNVTRDVKSHKAGANTVTIESKEYDTEQGKYSVGNTTPVTLTMTVNEAQALHRFLGKNLVKAS